ncbi:MAG TPA: hypothetical protein PLA87_11820 [Pseudomonadota bacterium]|nr:hypothetical protein [Pseudomonadota bacterium]
MFATRCNRLRTQLAVLAAILVLLHAREAWVSGSHAIRFLEPNFIYEYEEGVRKAFFNEEDASSYFGSKRERSTRVFTAALPLFTHFFQEAQQQGIELLDLRLRSLDRSALQSPAVQSAEQLVTKPDDVYPRLVKLDLQAGSARSGNVNHLLILLRKGVDANQASWLWKRISALSYAELSNREAEIAKVSPDASKRFLPGTAAVRVGNKFALSVGMTDAIRPENEKRFAAQAEALATELLPALTSAFASEDLLPHFFTGDHRKLISLQEKLGEKFPQSKQAELFNPYGPLLDRLGMRTSVQVGGLQVTLLLVVKGQWGAAPSDPQLSSGLTQWLQRVGDGPTQSDAQIDQLLKRAKNMRDPEAQRAAIDELVRLAKNPALRAVGGQRIIDSFVAHALSDPQQQDPFRQLALANLRWIDCPEKRRVYLELIGRRRIEGVMSVISQALADLPDSETSAALISVMSDDKASEDSRSWARNGLQTQLNYLAARKDPSAAPLQAQINRALSASR